MSGDKYDLSSVLGIFFTESRELLDEMENSLLELEHDPENEEAIRSVFRTAHTIKGSSGMFGLERIQQFTHAAETVLDRMRSRELAVTHDIISLFLECHDLIAKLLDLYEANKEETQDEATGKIYDDLLRRLNGYIGGNGTPGKKEALAAAVAAREGELSPVANECWHISLRFRPDVFRHRLDPFTFINYLSSLGRIARIKTLLQSLPALNDLDPESCFLGFEIDLEGDASEEKIAEVFDFVRDDCDIRILPPRSDIGRYMELIGSLPETPMQVGEILKSIGSITEEELALALKLQGEDAAAGNARPLGEIVVEQGMAEQGVVDAAVSRQKSRGRTDLKAAKSIRVDTTKLDTLIDQVGELVISIARLNDQLLGVKSVEIRETGSAIAQLVNDVRESSMNIRMVPIGESLQRFERVVRDLSRAEGKEVDFIINGGETELDKTLVEKITDPVMHLVRNAVDHGIGTPEARQRCGKSPKGRVTLNAFQETGSVIIEVKDDGDGLSRERIAAKAVERGLASAERAAAMTDDEVYRFIFEAGFSTAEKVTNVSGRGVGMDVVKKNIETLRGSVQIKSNPGEGTTVRLELPLTLSIIDGLLVDVGSSKFVFPLETVRECIDLSKHHVEKRDDINVLTLRGRLVSFLHLDEFFRFPAGKHEGEHLVIAEYGRRRVGFAVDRTVGEMQAVVKPIGKVFSKLRWISGATILGDGTIAMILDVPRLVQYVRAMEERKAAG